MPCHAMHPIQDLFLESFSYVLQFDMHFYVHSYVGKKNYSCKKWVLQYKTRNDKLHNKHTTSLAQIPGRQRLTILSVCLLGCGSSFPETRWGCHRSRGRGHHDLLDLRGSGQAQFSPLMHMQGSSSLSQSEITYRGRSCISNLIGGPISDQRRFGWRSPTVAPVCRGIVS
jgi:hypothetical protein